MKDILREAAVLENQLNKALGLLAEWNRMYGHMGINADAELEHRLEVLHRDTLNMLRRFKV